MQINSEIIVHNALHWELHNMCFQNIIELYKLNITLEYIFILVTKI